LRHGFWGICKSHNAVDCEKSVTDAERFLAAVEPFLKKATP
jgi:hypothetical protein